MDCKLILTACFLALTSYQGFGEGLSSTLSPLDLASNTSRSTSCVVWAAEAEGAGLIHNGSCGFFPGSGATPWDAEARALRNCQQNAGESPHGERCRCTIYQPALCKQKAVVSPPNTPSKPGCRYWRAEAEGAGPIHNGSCGFFPGSGSTPWEAEARAINNCRQNAGESPHGERCRCTIYQPALCER